MNRKAIAGFAALFCLTQSFCSAGFVTEKSTGGTNGISDETIRSKIVGTWIVNILEQTVSVKGTVAIATGGHFVTHGAVISCPKREFKFVYEGDWTVKDGFLIETVTSSNDSEIPIGCVTRDRVLRLNKEEFTYQAEDGSTETRKRQK